VRPLDLVVKPLCLFYCLIDAITVQVKIGQNHMSGNATYQELARWSLMSLCEIDTQGMIEVR
jgi:hypothetical protein